MSHLQALLLGIVQGLTEFFPVSSSGHLKLFQYYFGLKDLDHYIFFDLCCHLGTLFSIFFVFKKEISNLLSPSNIRLKQICLGIIPLFPLVMLLNSIKKSYNTPFAWSFGFLITAIYLAIGIRFQEKENHLILEQKEQKKISTTGVKAYRDAFLIGISQAVAILPGISRSGMTISSARILGWQPNEAISFSFLLAIPTILGGSLLEMINYLSDASLRDLPTSYTHHLIGFFVSFIVGIFALKLLTSLAMKNQLRYFVWYCGSLGIGSLIYFFITN